MKKILLSLSSLVFAGAIAAGGTSAMMAQTQTSTGNTFATGVIDLKVDNESYTTDNAGKLVFSPSTSWVPSSLAGKLFFNFLDLKPGDRGEDTISLRVHHNDAWSCMKVTLSGTPENSVYEPEIFSGDATAGPNVLKGELQDFLQFAFWADDGDNVYEKGEKIFKQGLVKDIFKSEWWRLADSEGSLWNSNKKPMKGGTTYYIGKFWCFGDLVADAVNKDNYGKTGNGLGTSTNGPLQRGTGFKCDGEPIGNITQSDGIKVDVSFRATQSRDNSKFKCSKL